MPFLEQLATINPDARTQPFWDACSRGQLRFQQCSACGAFRFPPLTGCRECGSSESEWVDVSGRGRVFSYTVVHHPAVPMIRDEVPYAVVVVEFDDAPGARLISNVLDTPPEDVHVGMELELVWDEIDGGNKLPRFRPV